MLIKDLFGFEGKNVLVTGAGSGMGEAAARLLVDLGAKVHAVGNVKKIKVPVDNVYYADLSQKDEIDRLIQELPSEFEALFICQGMAQTRDNALLLQKVNFLSVKYLAEALAPRVADNGSITIISSNGGYAWQEHFDVCKQIIDCKTYEETVAWYEAHQDVLKDSYRLSKRCLNAYVKCKVFDPMYIDRKIRLNCICPGNTITGLTDAFMRGASRTGDPEEGKATIEKLFQARWDGRWASAEEMGYPMVAIGSKIFSYMSGQIITFDYGTTSEWEINDLMGIPNPLK